MKKVVLDGVVYRSGDSWMFEGTTDQYKDRYFDITDLLGANLINPEHGAKIHITVEVE